MFVRSSELINTTVNDKKFLSMTSVLDLEWKYKVSYIYYYVLSEPSSM